MHLFNLSHAIENDMPLFPGTMDVTVSEVNSLETDGFRQKQLSISSHVGTHVDAPAHVLEKGACLDQLPLEKFYGSARVLDVRFANQQPIPLEVLNELDKKTTVDFILFYTGWQKHWRDGRYYKNDAPYLSESLAKALGELGLKGVGMDAPSVDAMDSMILPVHRILFAQNIIIIENLTHLQDLEGLDFKLAIFPLNIPQSDGSPVRAVGIVD